MFPIFVPFCTRTNTVEVDSRREVVSSLSFPRLTAVLPETQGGDVRREGVEAFNTMRQMTLDPVKCAAVSVHCWRITDVERTAAYEELRKQWRAESLIAHLTVFKDKHGLWTQRKRVQSCSCRGLNYFIWVSSLFYTKDAPSLTAPLTPPLSTRLQSKHYLY